MKIKKYFTFKHLFKYLKLKKYSRVLKFLIVGASGVPVNEFLLWFFTEIVGFFYLISGIIAIEGSIMWVFIFNDIWTFREQRKGNFFVRCGKFHFARFISLIINFVVLWALTSLGIYYLISNLIGIALATIINYVTSVLWVWRKKEK